jgi:hypothetical protein
MWLVTLCSLARNPDGTPIRPTPYEINAEAVLNLFAGAVILLLVGLIIAIIGFRLTSRRSTLGGATIGTIFMVFHPIWTASTTGGDCGELQVICSWAVLGVQGLVAGVQLVLLIWPLGDPSQRTDFDDQFRPDPPTASH